MKAIDAHAHAFPDALAERAIATLSDGHDWSAVGDGTVAGLLRSMDEAGIEASVLCTIATKPSQTPGILDWCKQVRSDRILPFPSVHPNDPEAADWVRRIAEEGFTGIKLHPMYQDFHADAPAADVIYGAAQDAGLIVTIHSGRDIAFPPDDDRAEPARLRHICEGFPDLTLLLTHMGGWRSWDDVQTHLIGRNVWIETSFSLHELPASEARAMILAHDPDRFCLGSDWPWTDQAAQIEMIHSLGLSDEQTEGILSTNARRLLNLD